MDADCQLKSIFKVSIHVVTVGKFEVLGGSLKIAFMFLDSARILLR